MARCGQLAAFAAVTGPVTVVPWISISPLVPSAAMPTPRVTLTLTFLIRALPTPLTSTPALPPVFTLTSESVVKLEPALSTTAESGIGTVGATITLLVTPAPRRITPALTTNGPVTVQLPSFTVLPAVAAASAAASCPGPQFCAQAAPPPVNEQP